MKKKQVWRYYCEFCKKSGCSAGHMRKHENSCTNNPSRICRMCRLMGHAQPVLADLIAVALKCPEDDIDELFNAADECPCCILAAIRQCGRQQPASEHDHGFSFRFDFKQQLKEAFGSINESQRDNY